MKNQLENQMIEDVHYSADNGFTVNYLTHLIRKRAYEIFEARGRNPGRELEDSFRAEQEMKHHFGL